MSPADLIHGRVKLREVRLHYVTAGEGEPVVLLPSRKLGSLGAGSYPPSPRGTLSSPRTYGASVTPQSPKGATTSAR